MKQSPVRMPQEFLDMLEENEISMPPVPGVVARFLQPVGEYLFSTHPGWEPVMGRHVVFSTFETSAAGEDSEAEETRFYCGLEGHGVQNWTFRYVLSAPRMEIGCVLPYGSAYGNAAADLQRIGHAFELIRGCLAVTRCGETFGEHHEGRLRMTMDEGGFSFVLHDAQGGVIRQGTRLEDFLNLLTIWGEPMDGARAQDWTRV